MEIVSETQPQSEENQENLVNDELPESSLKKSSENEENGSLSRDEILSRRKQKKILKLAKYEETKKLKRQRERQKTKERRAIQREQGIKGPTRKRKQLKQNKMKNSKNTVGVAIDFDYDELMSDKDIAKCAKQLLHVYTANRKSPMPIQLYYTSIREGSKIENALKRHDGYNNWDVNVQRESFLGLFDKESIVYLTSESDNVLTEIDPKAVYIIGGLVDHNHHKGMSYEKAQKNGLKTARLPLNEFISMKTRTVLTIVHGEFTRIKVS